MGVYEESAREHKELIGLLDREEAYLERIQESKQINFELLSEYKETLTAQYLLRGVMGLLGGFLVHLIIGASARWNMLNAYATSYYKLLNAPELIINEDSYASPLSLFCMGVGMRAGIRLEKAVGVLPTVVIAMATASLAIFLSSYMPNFQSKPPLTQCSSCWPSPSTPSAPAWPSTQSSTSATSTTPSSSSSSTAPSSPGRASDTSSSACSTTSASTPRTFRRSTGTTGGRSTSSAGRCPPA